MKKISLGSEMTKKDTFQQNSFEKQVFQVLTVFDIQVTYSFEIAFCLIIS